MNLERADSTAANRTVVTACVICGTRGPPAERARVRSNLRAFCHETFEVWRCGRCRSLHASEDVDLPSYYARYPFHGTSIDWRLRVMYKNLLRRLERSGLRHPQRILDYGCGGGHFVDYLRLRNYDAVGYDEYSSTFARPELLQGRYDFLLSQDVVEHVSDPVALLRRFDRLVEPGGLIAIGTPNASAIDLRRAEEHVHALHMPFHRHIFAKDALIEASTSLGWQRQGYYPSMYNNTRVPLINPRFILHYLRCFDNNLDLGFEPIRLSLRLLSPVTLFWALFGSFFAPETDVMVVFRRSG